MRDLAFRMDGGPVIIKITIEGLVSRKYTYYADEKRFKGDAAEPCTHALGMPADLHLDRNKWVFRMANQDNEAQGYSISIVWEQDGAEIDNWEKKGSLKPSAPVKEEVDSRDLVGLVAAP